MSGSIRAAFRDPAARLSSQWDVGPPASHICDLVSWPHLPHACPRPPSHAIHTSAPLEMRLEHSP
jgi:hypothetical protein